MHFFQEIKNLLRTGDLFFFTIGLIVATFIVACLLL